MMHPRHKPLSRMTVCAALAMTLAIALALVGFPARAAPPVSNPLPDTHFLPKAGDTWTYRIRSRDRYTKLPVSPWKEFQVRVVSVNGRTVVDEIVGDDKKSESGDTPALVALVAPNAYVLSPYLFDLRELPDDAKWTDVSMKSAGGDCGNNPDFRCSAFVQVDGDDDDFDIPAGKFNAKKVDVVMSIVSSGGAAKREASLWYDRSSKRFVRLLWHTDHGPWPDQDVEVQLVSSQLQ